MGWDWDQGKGKIMEWNWEQKKKEKKRNHIGNISCRYKTNFIEGFVCEKETWTNSNYRATCWYIGM